MADYRSMYDSDYLHWYDVWSEPGEKDVTVTIEKVEAGELTSQGGRKQRKPLVFFQGKHKALALNKTNGKSIAALYGPKTEAWAGKKITLYCATTSLAGETVECIRIRPAVAK